MHVALTTALWTTASGIEYKVALLLQNDMMDFGKDYKVNLARVYAHKYIEQNILAPGDKFWSKTWTFVKTEETWAAAMAEVQKDKYNMIVVTSSSQKAWTRAAALDFPDLHFVYIGFDSSHANNYVAWDRKAYQGWYMAGVAAGGFSSTRAKRVGFIGARKSSYWRRVNSYFLGAQVGGGSHTETTRPLDQTTEVIALWGDPKVDGVVRMQEAVYRLKDFGCDVMAYTGEDGMSAAVTALSLGMSVIGFDRDERLVLGEGVLTSISENWDAKFTQLVLHGMRGEFTNTTLVDHAGWFGLESGVPEIYGTSFLVSQATTDTFNSEFAKLQSGIDPYCYQIFDDKGVLQNPTGCSTNDFVKNSMRYPLQGVVDLGLLSLYGDVCPNGTRYVVENPNDPRTYNISCVTCAPGTYAYFHDPRIGSKECLPCRKGHFSDKSGSAECQSCPPSTFAAEGASYCTPCPTDKTNQGTGNDGCPIDLPGEDSMIWIWVLIPMLAVLLVGVPIVVWKTTANTRKLAALYNNNKVAEDCAAHIAAMDLEEADYILEIQNPNRIQRSFMDIITNLKEYRKYLPQSLLVGGQESEVTDHNTPNTSAGSSASTIRSQHEEARVEVLNQVKYRGLEKKSVSMVMIKMDGFDETSAGTSATISAMTRKVEQFCDLVANSILLSQGVISDMNLGNGIITGSWSRRNPEAAGECALGIVAKATQSTIELSTAVHSKHVLTGNLGGQTVCAPSFTGFLHEILDTLILVAAYHGAKVVTGSAALMPFFVKTPIDVIVSDRGMRNKAGHKYTRIKAKYVELTIHELHRKIAVEQEEWMYQLETAEKNDLKEKENETALEHYKKGEFEEAIEILRQEEKGSRLLQAMENDMFWPNEKEIVKV